MNPIELTITSSNTQNITQCALDIINIQWTLVNRIQGIETQESGWIFQEIDSMKKSFNKTYELKVSAYVKLPFRSFAF